MDLELTLMFHRCSTSIGLIRVGPNHNYMIVTHLATVLKEKFIIGFAECRRSLGRLLVSEDCWEDCWCQEDCWGRLLVSVLLSAKQGRLLVSVLLSAKQSTDTNNPPPTHII